MVIPRRALRLAPYAIVLALAAYLLHRAGQIDYLAPAGRIGPDFWPKLILGLMIAVCVYEIVRIAAFDRDPPAVGFVQRISPPAGAGAPNAAESDGPSYPLRLSLAIVATILYAALVPIVGFFLATFPYLVAFIRLGGYRRLTVAVPVSLVGSLLMLFFFWRIAYVSLPIGREPFASVSLFLMRTMGVR